MKKIIAIILTAIVCISFAACSKSNDSTKDETTTASTTVQSDSVDLDLTQLSSTVVYSEVYNMTSSPSDYKGKTVKMTGNFNQYYDEDSDKTYNTVVIPDAAACCQQGLEFHLADGSTPNFEQGEEITVVGSFNIYTDGEYLYGFLDDAQLVD